MKNWFKLTAIIFYLIIISVLLDFELTQLFDLKQFLLVIAGMIILFLPGFHIGENRRTYADSLARCALFASYIQAFIMLFIVLSAEHTDHILKDIAVNLRPLLYGFCLWIILSPGNSEQKNKTVSSMEIKVDAVKDLKADTAKDIQTDTVKNPEKICREAGLTTRETQIALLLLQNLHNAEIAGQLYISESTVKKHISNIYSKLEINRREELKERLM